jgi:hypothetical protein
MNGKRFKYVLKKFSVLSILVVSTGAISYHLVVKPLPETSFFLESPYQGGYQYQYKVNLHAHSTERSANYAYSPKELLTAAKKFGYDAFAITDLPEAGGIVADPGICGIIHIPGIEYGGTPHIVGLGITGFTKSTYKQEQIDHIKAQGGYAYLPHPDFGNYNLEMFSGFKNLDGVAVFNSLTYGVAVSDNAASEVIPYNEKLIDSILSRGTAVAILAEEDTKYEDPHKYGHQLNTAWINVWGSEPAAKISAEDILQIVKSKKFTSHGRFLRTSPEPPCFVDISTDGLRIRVRMNKKCNIEFVTFGGAVKKKCDNKTTAFYNVSPADKYVRVKATYSGKEGRSWAWTNPVYIKPL